MMCTKGAGLSIRFEVGGDILKKDGTGGVRPPKQGKGLKAGEAPSRVQGQTLKQNELTF